MTTHRFAPENLDTDVLIIGAGPGGLMAALALSRLGIKVKLLERRIPGEVAGQGDGFKPRMIEIWESLGIGAELRAVGSHCHRTAIYVPNDEGSGIKEAGQSINIPTDDTPYPYELGASSRITEGIMTRALTAQGIVIEQPTVPESLRIVKAEDGAGEPYVEVTIAKLDENYLAVNRVGPADRSKLVNTPEVLKERRVVRAKYVLGCDGAHSWVRKAVSIALEGEMTNLVWGVVDFTPDTNLPTVRAKTVIASPLSGGILHIPREDNKARVYVSLRKDPNTVAADETQKSTSKESQEKIIQSIEKAYLPYTMRLTNITWCNEYKVGQRVATTFSASNRVFLLGDAARTHSPMAGQGANSAMTDAYDIAWKLAYVLQGRAKADILDTYEAERRVHALELIQLDQDIFDTFRPGVFTAEAFAKLLDDKLMFVSGLGVKCRSRLTVPDDDHLAPGLSIGERVPCVDITRLSDWSPSNLLDLMAYNGHFKLIFLPGDTRVSSFANLLNTFSGRLVGNLSEEVLKFLDIFTVLNIPKDAVCDNLRLPPAFRITENVYVDEAGRSQARQNGRLYQSLGIRPDEGVVIVVRPDCVTTMVTRFLSEDVDKIANYFTTL
ncbi:hypothetical protein DAEQUDRAFT_409008 [Daedalea quercina L-15889]|uniref:FAD-binding domain-containing protein n=1 Tax=Daedalea quercina L-15889 TaxID=1314783 RepID=A0A165NK37_9APHY|nr:hypothetical protein DAEQUDRAFT_409008 [Daedalea quercina L-15889]